MCRLFEKSKDYIEAELEREKNYNLLRERLEPEQRKLLLRMADAQNLMQEYAVSSAFRSAYRLGARIVADALR